MEIKTHIVNEEKVAEIVSDEIIINSVEDALELVGNIYYQGFEKLVISEKNLTSDFFNLKNKLAGDILQKFLNYRIRLSIIGDFKKYESQSLRDFILESNKGKQINFVGNLTDGLT